MKKTLSFCLVLLLTIITIPQTAYALESHSKEWAQDYSIKDL